MENGILHFQSLEALLNALKSASDSEEGFVSNETLNKWEEKIGFKSLRRTLLEKQEEIENEFDREPIYVLSYFLSPDRLVYIDKALNCFKDGKQIVVLNGGLEKLTTFFNNPSTQQDSSVHVFQYQFQPSELEMRECGTNRHAEKIVGNKKITGDWNLSYMLSPIWDNQYGYVRWDMTVFFDCNMTSKKKVLGIWVNNNSDVLSWGCGYGAAWNFGSMSSGTGWTQGGPAITYFHQLFPIVSWPYGDPLNPLPNIHYYYTYCGPHFSNVSAGFECSDECF